MRSRTIYVFSAAFHTALLAACKEKASSDVVSVPTVPTGNEIITTTPSSTASSAPLTRVETIDSNTLGFGQRCMGKLVAGLKPGKPVDSIELRLEYFQPDHKLISAGRTGTPCTRAANPTTCRDAVETTKPSGTGEWLVYTRVDEVGVVSGKDVAAFLAPIDTPEEAAMALVYGQAQGSSAAAVLPTCDPAEYHASASGFEMLDVQMRICNESTKTTYLVQTDGITKILKTEHAPPTPGCQRPFLGRRPEGLEEGHACGDDVGAFFARCAELEAASVHAFARLERELRELGAPRALRDRARRARKDEIRHARSMRALARRHGGTSSRSRIPKFEDRDLEAIAIENAVEGCVAETFGALIALWQSKHAKDEVVRNTHAKIARDETRHAALAHDLAAWLDARLPEESKERVRAAKENALRELREAIPVPSDELALVAGLPRSNEVDAMIRALNWV